MTEDAIQQLYRHCTLCPRRCGADRYKSTGFCGAGARPRLAKAMVHMWEEPVLAGSGGSGAVFFSHCTLKCIFCQNYSISAEGFGREVNIGSLADIFLGLEADGADNIDLVTPSHFLPSVIAALDRVRHRLSIPVVYNCGGYEAAESIRMLDGYVDIYLPDVKYYDDSLAVRYSAAPGYYETAAAAVDEMLRQVGEPQYGCDGRLKRGIIIRHMVLPSHRADSIMLLHALKGRFDTGSFLISLLSQYTPSYLALTDPAYNNINRRVFSYEYDAVVREALELGFTGFMQEKSSAKEEYTPVFDLSGLPDA